MAGASNNQCHEGASRDKWKDTVNNLRSRFSTPSLSIFNDGLVSATENLSLSLPLAGNTDKIRDRVKSIGSDIRRLRSKSCERVFQRCRRGLDKVVKKEQPQENTFHHNATLRQSRRCRTKKAKPTKTSYKTYARATVDVTPSPYDTEALSLRVGDMIGVISQHPSGIWTGECEGKIGRFKFINVELVESKKVVLEDKKVFSSLTELLDELNLGHLKSKLELNGYERAESLETILRPDLEYLGISDLGEQDRVLELGAALATGDIRVESSAGSGEARLDSGCYDVTSLSSADESLETVETRVVVERRSVSVQRRTKQLSLGEVWSQDVCF